MSVETDWKNIEIEYKSGQFSIRAIAGKYGVPESTVRNRARIEKWERNLTAQVRSAANNKILRSSAQPCKPTENGGLRTELRTFEPSSQCAESDGYLSDDEIVDQASEHVKDVVLQHRQSLEKCQQAFDKVMDSILSEQTKITDKNRSAIARDYNNCTVALARMIATERKAYNLDDDKVSEEDKEMAELMALIAEEETEAGPLGK